MRKRSPGGRRSGPKRRNPMARALRDPLFRARREANRRKYSRKGRQGRPRDGDDATDNEPRS